MQSSENINMTSHKCLKCNNTDDFVITRKGPHIGLYCKKCGAWIKWIKKNEGKVYQITMDDIVKREQNTELDTEGTFPSDKEQEDEYFGECPWD